MLESPAREKPVEAAAPNGTPPADEAPRRKDGQPMHGLAAFGLGMYHLLVIVVLGLALYHLWPRADMPAVSLPSASAQALREADVEPARLVAALQAGAGPGAALRARLPETLARQLAEYKGTGAPPSQLVTPLLQALNDAIETVDLSREASFREFLLPPALKRLAASDPSGEDLVRLNRALLSIAFPTAIRPAGGPASDEPSRDVWLLLLVATVGAMGSFVHSSTAFTVRLGNRTLHQGWGWWYVEAPFVGAALALLFYFAVRGLSVGMVSRTAELNLFGIVSLAGLAGLFSRQASQKLHEIFETALNTRERRDDRGGDRSTSPSARLRRPVLSGIEPSAVPPGQATPLALQGEGFLRTSRVRVGNLELVPEFDSATRLRIALAAEQVAAVGSLPVLVINPDGGASEIQTLEVRA